MGSPGWLDLCIGLIRCHPLFPTGATGRARASTRALSSGELATGTISSELFAVVAPQRRAADAECLGDVLGPCARFDAFPDEPADLIVVATA